MPKIIYPSTKRIAIAEQHFGQTITDPYRWLEQDGRNNNEVWVEFRVRVPKGVKVAAHSVNGEVRVDDGGNLIIERNPGERLKPLPERGKL